MKNQIFYENEFGNVINLLENISININFNNKNEVLSIF